VGRRQRGRALVGGRGVAVAAQSPEQVRAGRVERVVAREVELVHQRQCGGGTVQLADGDGAVEGDDRRGRDREQLVIEGDDLRPGA